jgi:ABC-type sugar transport system substrate-binding protein
MTRKSRLATLALAVAAVTAMATSPASAANGTVGERETVCAQDLFVRVTAPHGAWMGTLYRGQTFLVEQDGGDWVYGFAYGNINRRGWVQNGWFC